VIDTYRKLLDLLTPRERRLFFALMAMILVMGVFEMMSVASILPLMMVLRNPSIIDTNPWLSWAYTTFGFESHQSFEILLAAAVFALVVCGTAFKIVTSYSTYRFATMRGYTISSRMLNGYLFQPYTWFLNRHSAALGSAVLGEVQKVVNASLLPSMKLVTYSVVVIALVTLLVLVRPEVALAAAGIIGGVYVVLYLTVRQKLGRMGKERHALNAQRFRIVGEAFGGMKDVKLMGLEPYFTSRFREPAQTVARYDAITMVIREVPRYAIEAIGFGGLIGFILYLLLTGDGSLGGVVPVLSVYAFAAIRLLPALQRIYTSVGQMRFSKPTLDKLHHDFTQAQVNVRARPGRGPALHLTERMTLRDVHFSYPEAERSALQGLDLEVPAKTTVGIVGGTGAGKTTAVDIMLGLLDPQQGALLVDGTLITRENRASWQASIGYVPQHIFLIDDTVSGNIAFGRKAADIDQAAVERAARIAEIHDFVMREMPKGYDTFVGERGVRLSGGQRQRIGIARALYHDPDVLILDEATSALDNLTEKAVMDAVHNLGHAKTIVMIAHRLSTVRDCDIIFMLEEGRVIASGSYDELIETNRQFRALAGA
jgi:ATP-binding cassette, subfamily B, bacterial PglK